MDLTVHRHHLVCVSVREVPMWCNNSRCFRRLIMSLMPAHSKSTNLDIFLVQKMRIVCDSCFDAFVKINVLDKTKHVLWKHTQMCIWYISHLTTLNFSHPPRRINWYTYAGFDRRYMYSKVWKLWIPSLEYTSGTTRRASHNSCCWGINIQYSYINECTGVKTFVFFSGEALETRSDIAVPRTYKNIHSVTYVNIYSTMFQKFTDLIISGKISVEMPG